MSVEVYRHIVNQTLSLTIGEGEKKDIVLLDPENIVLNIRQLRSSHLFLCVVSMTNQSANNTIQIDQDEEGAELEMRGLVVAGEKAEVRYVTSVRHNAPHGESNQLFKYILSDSASCAFVGEIKVLPNSQKVAAYQTNRNILLSPTARILAKPQLEIYADDVKCSHGASTGQLDETALFYMQQRGISLSSARRLLLHAFAEEVVSVIKDDSLREEIIATLEKVI